MAVVVGVASFLFLKRSKERGGEGWLKHCGSLHQKEEALTLIEVEAPLRPLVVAHQQLSCSYKSILMMEPSL